MKFLALILILTITAQPLQAGSCDMDSGKGQQTAHHQMDSDHGGHPCCDPQDNDQPSGCDSDAHCGWCFVSVPALPVLIRINPTWTQQPVPDPVQGVILPSHNTPPFRPPIA